MTTMRVVLRVAIGLAAAVVSGCAASTRLEDLVEARHQSATLLLQFMKAVDASNRAVMADTDERSTAFAKEAQESSHAAQQSVETLSQLLQHAHFEPELARLRTFGEQFAQYRELDGQVLELAVENTNLKAQRLSWGAALEAADSFRDALTGTPPRRAADALRVRAAAATAIAAVREIHALQAPHIAEAEDAAMTALELRMDAAAVTVRRSLAELKSLAAPKSDSVTAATSAFDRFMTVHAELLALSRRNSNVRSLALTLNQKRALTVECEASALALRDELAARSLGGYR